MNEQPGRAAFPTGGGDAMPTEGNRAGAIEMDWDFHATELDAIEAMAQRKGGTKKDGSPFTREDAKEVLRAIYERNGR